MNEKLDEAYEMREELKYEKEQVMEKLKIAEHKFKEQIAK